MIIRYMLKSGRHLLKRYMAVWFLMTVAAIVTLSALRGDIDDAQMWLYIGLSVLVVTFIFIVAVLFVYAGNLRLMLQLFYNENMAAIMLWQTDGTVIDLNESYMKMFGFDKSLIGKNWLEYGLSEEDDFEVASFVEDLKRQKISMGYMAKSKRADEMEIDVLWNDYYVERLDLIISFGIDITEKLESERTIRKLAHRDSLTNLENFYKFKHDVSQWLERDESFYVYALNINKFKRFNELHGYDNGERLLRGFADALSHRYDQVYRWEGDTFLVVLQSGFDTTGHGDALAQLLAMNNRLWYFDELEYLLSFSCGGIGSHQVRDVNDLVMRLNLSLHTTHRSEHMAFIPYSDSIEAAARMSKEKEEVLKKALENEAFDLHVQPIIAISDNHCHCFEVLLRMREGGSHFRHIGELIEFAEQTGQIRKVDQMVMSKTFRYLEHASGCYDGCYVTVNVSAHSFVADWFIPFVKKNCETHPRASKLIIFEITEYVMIDDVEKAMTTIDALHKMGIRVALDDFGTEYSSINYLGRLPFDIFKLDRSYISQIDKDSKMKYICSTLIQLAKHLNMAVIAEGIETEGQRDMLKSLGCELGQGYLFSRPFPIDQMNDWIRDNDDK